MLESLLNGRNKIRIENTKGGLDIKIASNQSVAGVLVEGIILVGFLIYLYKYFNI